MVPSPANVPAALSISVSALIRGPPAVVGPVGGVNAGGMAGGGGGGGTKGDKGCL